MRRLIFYFCVTCVTFVGIGAGGCGTDTSGRIGDTEIEAATGPDDAIRTLRMVLTPDDGDPQPLEIDMSPARVAARAFAGPAEGLSNGELAVHVISSGQICDKPETCLAALQDRRIDVYRSTVSELGLLIPELHALDIPYLFESDEVVQMVFAGSFFARMRDAIIDRTGLRLMGVSNAGGWRSIASGTPVIRTPSDMRKLTLRTFDSPVEAEWARALGALPVVAPLSELSDALADGRVSGATDGEVALVQTNIDGSHLTLTRDRHGYQTALWLMSDSFFQTLSSDLQRILQSSFDEMVRVMWTWSRTRETEAIEEFEAAGGRVLLLSAEERKAFLMAAGRVSTWHTEMYGYDWLVWLEGAISEAERAIAMADRKSVPTGF